jgi:hypothetical protein
MAYSYVDLAGTAGQQNFNFSFSYLSSTHLSVYIDSVLTTAWSLTSTFTVRLDSALAAEATVRIRRVTPIDEPVVDFTGGSVMAESDLDMAFLQIIYAEQELEDFTDLSTLAAEVANAAASAAAALASQTAAAASAAAAALAETAAELAETNAETAETNAELAETNAEAAEAAAAISAAAAAASATAAQTAETNAETAETNAETAETNAEAAQAAAEAARDAALTAQTAAELAETNAETAETNAELAETNAETAEVNAEAAQAAAEAAQAAAEAAAAEIVQYTNANPIINPCMDIWQRGTSFLSAASGIYTADRWAYSKSNAAVHDITQSTDVPTVAEAGVKFNVSVLVDCTTADAAVAAGDYVQFYQVIEGYNWKHFAQRALTLTFWVKATKTGIYCLSLTNTGGDRTFLAEYTVNAADTWEKKTINISASPSAGTWDYGSGHGLIVRFCLVSGTTYQGSTGWSTGNFLATANQVNACDNTANNWRLTGVKMELGSTATDLRWRSFQEEVQLCQRYYETRSATLWSGEVVNPQVYYHSQSFNTFKRASPTMAYGFIGQNGFAASVPATFSAESQGFTSFKAANATVSGGFLHYSWTADAEL